MSTPNVSKPSGEGERSRVFIVERGLEGSGPRSAVADGPHAAVSHEERGAGTERRAPFVTVAAVAWGVLDDIDVASVGAAVAAGVDALVPVAAAGVGVHARINRLLTNQDRVARPVVGSHHRHGDVR